MVTNIAQTIQDHKNVKFQDAEIKVITIAGKDATTVGVDF